MTHLVKNPIFGAPARRLLTLTLLTLAHIYGNTTAYAQGCETPQRIRFSMIPLGDVDKAISLYQPLFRRIERLTGRPVVAVRPSSYASVVEGLLGNSIDIASLGPATYIEGRKGDTHLTPFATMEKRAGVFQTEGPYYRAMLVSLNNSRFVDIASLKGANLALTDPGSTSGSLLPRKQFAPRVGSSLDQYFGSVSFSGSHGKSLTALLRGDVDTAFISSAQLEKGLSEGKFPSGGVRVLWSSDPIPYDPFVFRGQLCESLKGQIVAAFLGEESTHELHTLLEDLEAERFIPVDDKNYEGIRKILGQ